MSRSLRIVTYLIITALVVSALALSAAVLVQTLPAEQFSGIHPLIERIWWPATAIRIAIYALLAAVVYPRWVNRHLPPVALGGEKQAWQARALQRHRAQRRAPIVFIALLASDGLWAQWPYWLLQR